MTSFNSKLVFFTLSAAFFVAVMASDYGYGGGSYYNNHYAPIYSINTGGNNGRGNKGQNNNMVIRNSYGTSYGGQKGYGYGDDSYGKDKGYNSYYSNCISNIGNNGRRNRNDNNDLLLALLGGGCGGGLGGLGK